MSWLFSRALAEAYSAAPSSDGAPFVPSSATPTPQAFLCPVKMTDAWSRFPSGMMCAHLTEPHGEELLKWYLEVSLAKTYPEQKPTTAAASMWPMDWMGNARDCGPKWQGSFAKYDPASSSWKMSQLFLMDGWDTFSGTWPRWGMVLAGESFQLPPLVPRTTAKEYFFLLTPSASDGKKRYSFRASSLAGRYRKHPNGNLAEQVSFLAQERGVQDGRLNPLFWEWMIGMPLGWTDYRAAATDKFQQWQQSHGKH